MMRFTTRSAGGRGRAVAAALIAAIAAGAGGPVRAQGLVEFEFSGVVVDDTGNLGIFGSPLTVALNDSFTGRFSYMTGPGNPDQLPADAENGGYNLATFEIDQAIVSFTPQFVGVRHRPGLPSIDPMAPPSLGSDRFVAAAGFVFAAQNWVVALSLEAPFDAVFSSDALPASLSLGAFTTEQHVVAIRTIGLMGFPSQIDEGQLTSLEQVPEPGGAVLVLIAACGSVCGRRRLVPRVY